MPGTLVTSAIPFYRRPQALMHEYEVIQEAWARMHGTVTAFAERQHAPRLTFSAVCRSPRTPAGRPQGRSAGAGLVPPRLGRPAPARTAHGVVSGSSAGYGYPGKWEETVPPWNAPCEPAARA